MVTALQNGLWLSSLDESSSRDSWAFLLNGVVLENDNSENAGVGVAFEPAY